MATTTAPITSNFTANLPTLAEAKTYATITFGMDKSSYEKHDGRSASAVSLVGELAFWKLDNGSWSVCIRNSGSNIIIAQPVVEPVVVAEVASVCGTCGGAGFCTDCDTLTMSDAHKRIAELYDMTGNFSKAAQKSISDEIKELRAYIARRGSPANLRGSEKVFQAGERVSVKVNGEWESGYTFRGYNKTRTFAIVVNAAEKQFTVRAENLLSAGIPMTAIDDSVLTGGLPGRITRNNILNRV